MPAGDGGDGAALWVVHLEGDGGLEETMAALDSILLSPNPFLVRSDLTQSRLYHLVKRQTAPRPLFVGRLAEPPKFKGMETGSLAELRSWDAAGEGS